MKNLELGLGILAPLAVASLAAQAAAPAAFEPAATYRTGAAPASVAIADVNRDGKLNLVVGNSALGAGGGISVLPGRGDGRFASRTDYTADNVTAVAVSDASLDGKPDIVALSGRYVATWRNNGGGSFRPAILGDLMATQPSLALADLNRDGKLNAVTSSVELGAVAAFGDGSGTFPRRALVEVAGFAFQAAVADVDRDGRPDLLVVRGLSRPNDIGVLLGRGDGSFAPPTSVPIAPDEDAASVRLLAADLTFDGKPDLVWLSPLKRLLVVRRGRGDGSFADPVAAATASQPSALAVADVNRDGKPDVVVTNYGANTVSVFLGQGDGRFLPRQDFAVGLHPTGLAVADVNADGRPDLVVANTGDATVSVLLGR